MVQNKKKRLFIAGLLPEALREKIKSLQRELQGLPLRLVPCQNLHLTLVFLGDVQERQVPSIETAVNQVVTKFQPFEISLKSLSPGPSLYRPRLIWIELEPNSVLAGLYQALENNLVKTPSTGYRRKENRPFKGHITIARFQRGVYIKNFSAKSLSGEFQVKTLAIMESILRPEGAFYKEIKRFSLGNDKDFRYKI